MQLEVNGTRLWFDVDGPALVPDGPAMRKRPTVVLLHGGPGSYDHSYFKPDFEPLAREAQIVYLDLRGHGRSARHDPAQWTFEVCADDVRAFCDALDITKPVVYGHSMGGFVAMLYGARHPGHAAAIVLQSTSARFDLPRMVEGFRRVGGGDVAELGVHGMELYRRFDVVDQLSRVTSRTLVCVGERDPVTPVDASREIVDGLPEGSSQLEVIEEAGHFPWKDAPGRYWELVTRFVTASAATPGA